MNRKIVYLGVILTLLLSGFFIPKPALACGPGTGQLCGGTDGTTGDDGADGVSSGEEGEDGENGTGGGKGTSDPVGQTTDKGGSGGSGGDGGNGGNGADGADGRDGGDQNVSVDTPISGDVVVSSQGSDGSVGGDGGNGGKGGNGGEGGFSIYNNGGDGGDGGNGGNGGDGGHGGDGGNGGSIVITVNVQVDGSVMASSEGGDGAQGGQGGQAGNGGNGGKGGGTYTRYGGAGGDGGDGGVTPGSGGASGYGDLGDGPKGDSGSAGQSLDGQAGEEGQDGSGGAIEITINAVVTGDVIAQSENGTVDVKLNDGAAVDGIITANSDADSTLTFDMVTKQRDEYKAALAALVPANASGGTLTINGETFTWTDFDDLVNQVTLVVIEKEKKNKNKQSSEITYPLPDPPVVFCNQQDGRINDDGCESPIAIYQTVEGIEIYPVAGNADSRSPVFWIALENVIGQPVGNGQVVLLLEGQYLVEGKMFVISLWRLPGGEVQVVVMQPGGETHTIRWDLASP